MPPDRKVTASYSVEILLSSYAAKLLQGRDFVQRQCIGNDSKCQNGLGKTWSDPATNRTRLLLFNVYSLSSLKLVSMMLVKLPRDRISAEAAPYMDVVVYVGTRRKRVERHEQKLRLLDLHLVLPLRTIKALV
jgi:hypothetical protein